MTTQTKPESDLHDAVGSALLTLEHANQKMSVLQQKWKNEHQHPVTMKLLNEYATNFSATSSALKEFRDTFKLDQRRPR